MNIEIAMASEHNKAANIAVRETPEGRIELQEIMSRRRMIRSEVDDFVRKLGAGDLVEFAIHLGRVAFTVAGACAQFGTRPEFAHYAEAIISSMADAQHEMDRALQVSDWHKVRVAAAKMQVVWYGCVANLGIPYGELLKYQHEKYMTGQPVVGAEVATLLRKAGMVVAGVEGETANDEVPPCQQGDCPHVSDCRQANRCLETKP